MELSSQIKEINGSPTLAITAKANKLKKAGQDIIGLGAGEPDFETPKHIKQAGCEAIEAGITTYTDNEGLKKLRESICDYLKSEVDIEYESDNIIVSNGAKHSLFNVMQAVIGQGDEVILPAPYWVSYPEQIKFAGGKVNAVETKESNDFKLTAKEFLAAINENTKAIIINSPNNPTGAVYQREELTEIAEVAVENDIIIISDDIYGKISYEADFVSIASLNEQVKKQTVVINGVSKAYAMTGWRIGYAAGPTEVVEAMSRLQSHSTSNANSIAQIAAKEALSGTQKPTLKMVEEFKQRRDLITEKINQISGLKAKLPKGAFYLFVNVKELLGKEIAGQQITNDQSLANLLLEKAGVATVPGSYFGKEGYLRLSYASSETQIEAALNKIAETIEQN